MGCVDTIDHKRFPKQGKLLGQRVIVCFMYDTRNTVGGVCVRDDMEAPMRTIVKLDDGRHVLASECQYCQ